MKYLQILLMCTVFISSAAIAQTPDVMRAFEHISPDELDQDDISRPESNANFNENKLASASFSIYPNPSKGGASKISLRTLEPNGSSIQVSIIDATGYEFNVRQFTSSGTSFEYNLNEFNVVKPGIYTVKVLHADQLLTEQWIVQ